MATWEHQLLSRIIRTGNLSEITHWGIGPDDFTTNEGQSMFRMIQSYEMATDTSGSVLGVESMQHYFPNFQLCDDASMTTEALCKEVRRIRLDLESTEYIRRALVLTDPMQRAAMLQQAMNTIVNIGYGQTTDIRAGVGAAHIQNSYALRERGIDLSVGRWPWDIMNEELDGFAEDDYVIFFGRPKSFKSWILVYIVASLLLQGKRILVYTKEMTWEQMLERIICCIAGIRYWNFRKGKLSIEEKQKFDEIAAMLQAPSISSQLTILSGLDSHGNDTVPWIKSKIDNYKPDFVAIDGLHLMTDVHKARKREERITNISRETRAMVLATHVPVIATVQANRAAAKHNDANLDEIAYSDALGQDGTVLIRTIKDKIDDDHPDPTISLVIGAMRNGVLDGFRINALPAVNFEFHSKLSAGDVATINNVEESNGTTNPKPNNSMNGINKPMTENGAATVGINQVNHVSQVNQLVNGRLAS